MKTLQVVFTSECEATLNDMRILCQELPKDYRSGVVSVEVEPFMHFTEREALRCKMGAIEALLHEAERVLNKHELLEEYLERV